MKYVVLKIDDLIKHCSIEQRKQLLKITETVENGRKQESKKENDYLVVNMDEPYANQVLELIKEHEGEKVTFGKEDDMEDTIPYSHLVNELIKDSASRWSFRKVTDLANKYRLELSDEDFKRFFKLHKSDIDVDWLMHKMTAHKLSLTDALVLYLAY